MNKNPEQSKQASENISKLFNPQETEKEKSLRIGEKILEEIFG